MADLPTCPSDYSCTFTPLHPRIVTHQVGPWWHKGGGLAVVIIALIVIAIVLCVAINFLYEHSVDKRKARELELKRKHDLAVEEQRTMQIDAAKGNPEMLEVVRSLQNR